jgi:hypothetical protein
MHCGRPALVCAAILAVTAAGCGPSRPAVAPVRGQITLGGEPVKTGVVWFYPATSGRPAIGEIGADGRYTLGTFAKEDGAMLGSHVVVIESRMVSPPKNRPAAAPAATLPADTPEHIRREFESGLPMNAANEITWIVPEKYAAQATTPLRAEVQPGRNTIDFDIPSPAN